MQQCQQQRKEKENKVEREERVEGVEAGLVGMSMSFPAGWSHWRGYEKTLRMN